MKNPQLSVSRRRPSVKKAETEREAAKTGPKPATLKISGQWEDATKLALAKKRPAKGWPKPDK